MGAFEDRLARGYRQRDDDDARCVDQYAAAVLRLWERSRVLRAAGDIEGADQFRLLASMLQHWAVEEVTR